MLKRRLFSIWVLLIIAAGCSTADRITGGLVPATTLYQLDLPENLASSEETKHYTLEQGLFAGVYVGELENELGVFYRGPNPAMWHRYDNEKKIHVYLGGIWVPKNPAESPKIYALANSAKVLDGLPDKTVQIEQSTVDLSPLAGQAAQNPQYQSSGGTVGTALGAGIVSAIAKDAKLLFAIPPSSEAMLKIQSAIAQKTIKDTK